MILLLGATGYIGQAFSSELRQRRISFIPLTRKAVDYSNFDVLFGYIRRMKPEFVINAAGLRSKSKFGGTGIGPLGSVVRQCPSSTNHRPSLPNDKHTVGAYFIGKYLHGRQGGNAGRPDAN